jgi:hypothetical protein
VDARKRYGVIVRSAGEAGCPLSAEDFPSGGGSGSSEKFEVTRQELVALVDQALKARGIA